MDLIKYTYRIPEKITMKRISILLMVLIAGSGFRQANAQLNWKITPKGSIMQTFDSSDPRPYTDNIEMAGRKVSGIIYYKVDESGRLHINRNIFFPQLRIYNKFSDPEWKSYRAYLQDTYSDELLPVITLGENIWMPEKPDSIEIEGKLIFYMHPLKDLRLVRTLMPSMHQRAFIEKWHIENVGTEIHKLQIGNILSEANETGYKGNYNRAVFSEALPEVTIKPGEKYIFSIYYTARLNDEPADQFRYGNIEAGRDSFLAKMKENLQLRSPDPVLNTMFYFSKIRAAENLFTSKMGLVHSPGGSNYYAGVWANDQAEYSGPFFPFLGYADGNLAAYNCYKMFLNNIPQEGKPITSSFEMEGDLTCCGKDRGDAAMIAFGASQFALLRAHRNTAEELWPLIEWCLDYCHRMKDENGVIRSSTDEMEGRISTGEANLATSSLYYGGLKFASNLAREIGKERLAKVYDSRLKDLEIAIETHFGHTFEGLETYRYFEGNEHLRHWICLPLVMGINKRKEATVNALLNKLWTDNGVLVELNTEDTGTKVFWDRGTLYALRGTFKAGATDQTLEKLQSFSTKRLLGDHVPYVVEAWPENDMKHLSAESALYCRIFPEGLLRIEPVGFRSFTIAPRMPSGWTSFSLERIHIGDVSLDISLARSGNRIRLTISNEDKVIFNKLAAEGKTVFVKF